MILTSKTSPSIRSLLEIQSEISTTTTDIAELPVYIVFFLALGILALLFRHFNRKISQ